MATNHIDELSQRNLTKQDYLNDIRSGAKATTIPPSVDYAAIAVQAVDEYWSERDMGLIDRDGHPTDETSMLHRLALRRITSPVKEYLTDLFVTIVPPLFVVLALLFCPFFTNRKFFLFLGRYAPLSGWAVGLFAAFLGIWFFIRLMRTTKNENSHSYHFVGGLVGGLLAAALVLGLSGYGMQEKISGQRASQDYLNSTMALTKDRMLDISRVTLERSLTTGSFEKAALRTTDIELSNKKRLRISPERVSSQTIVYRGQTEDLPGAVVATLDKSSGRITEESDNQPSKTLNFFVGTVVSVSNGRLTFKLLDAQAKEITVTLSLDNLVLPPSPGETVFVVTDSDSNVATEVTGL